MTNRTRWIIWICSFIASLLCWVAIAAVAIALTACGGGGSAQVNPAAPAAPAAHLTLNAARVWSAATASADREGHVLQVHATPTALIVQPSHPGAQPWRAARLGPVLARQGFGLRVAHLPATPDLPGGAIALTLLCEGREVNPDEGGIPAPAVIELFH